MQALQRAGRDWNLADHLFDIYLSVRRFDSSATRMIAGFSGRAGEVRAARKNFDALAKRMGAIPLGVDAEWRERRFAFGYRRDTLLDRGAAMDRLELCVRWADLPTRYVAIRSALKQAMRRHAPRTGAHGLVFCHVGSARPESATMTFTWAYPRILEDGVAQAQNIRQAALAASGAQTSETLEREVLRAVKAALDPQAILNPGRGADES